MKVILDLELALEWKSVLESQFLFKKKVYIFIV